MPGCAGKSNNEVSAGLRIRSNTAKNHLARMCDKANVGNRTEPARWALGRGLVQLMQRHASAVAFACAAAVERARAGLAIRGNGATINKLVSLWSETKA